MEDQKPDPGFEVPKDIADDFRRTVEKVEVVKCLQCRALGTKCYLHRDLILHRE